jgi:hypothetical protein
VRGVDLRVLAYHPTVSVNFADQLPIQVKQTEEQERPSGNSGKPVPDFFLQREPEQGEKQTQHGREQDMPASGKRGDSERLCMIPVLRTCRQDKRQPMCRDRRVKKSHRESRDRDGRENCFVHIRKKCGKSLSASPLHTKIIGLVGFEPTASWSRTRRSTKLSHSPKSILTLGVRGRCATYFAYFGADSKEIESVVRGLVFETIEVLRT